MRSEDCCTCEQRRLLHKTAHKQRRSWPQWLLGALSVADICLGGRVRANALGMSAQPSYRMLGRLGHELLTQTEHTCGFELMFQL